MKNHSRNHSKKGSPGFRTPSTFRGAAHFRIQKAKAYGGKNGKK